MNPCTCTYICMHVRAYYYYYYLWRFVYFVIAIDMGVRYFTLSFNTWYLCNIFLLLRYFPLSVDAILDVGAAATQALTFWHIRKDLVMAVFHLFFAHSICARLTMFVSSNGALITFEYIPVKKINRGKKGTIIE